MKLNKNKNNNLIINFYLKLSEKQNKKEIVK